MVLKEQQLPSAKKRERKIRDLQRIVERTKCHLKLVESKVAQLLNPILAGERKCHIQHFDEMTFEDAFIFELSRAKASVLIQSPYMTPHRVSRYLEAFIDCIRRGVTVCVFIEDREGNSRQHQQTREAVEMLVKIGVHVNFRMEIHEKLLIIDCTVLWSGSLNILSFNGRKSEEIARSVDEQRAWMSIFRFRLHVCTYCVGNAGRKEMFMPQGINEQLKRLGREFKLARKQKHISLRQLARLVGTTKDLIQLFEGGKRNAEVFSLIEMCVWLDAEVRLIPHPLLPTVSKLLSEWNGRDYANALPVDDASTRFMPKRKQGTEAQPTTSGHPQT